MKQSEKIIFRIKPEMKLFVKEFSEKMGMDISEFMRMVLEYYYLAYFTKQMDFNEIRRKFFRTYPTKEAR